MFHASLDLTVSAPSGLPVAIRDTSGDLRVDRLAGSRINDSSGDVRIDGDSSGDIAINDVGRNLTVLADTSGDVRVSGVKGTVSVPKD